jgi:uncharacterized repeat protein (TIGR01451 family)
MNTFRLTNRFAAKFITILSVFSLFVGMVPMQAVANVGASIGFVSTAKASYAQNEEVVLKVLRGIVLPANGTVQVTLSSANGGEFRSGTLAGACSGTFSGTGSADISNGDTQKAFCYRNANPGSDTITATLTKGSDTDVATLVIVIDEAPVEPPDPNENTALISICHATGAYDKPYETPEPSDGAKVVSGHDGHNGPVWFEGITDKWGDIIPPFTWYEKVGTGKDAAWEPREYLGKNWTDAGKAIWNNGCNIPANEADLAITKTVSTATPFEGTDVTYTLTVTNSGPMSTVSAVVTDPLAAGLTYKSATVEPTTTAPLTWNLPVLASGASWSVDVVVTVGGDQGGLSITNTASVTGAPSDPDTEDNEDSVTIRPVDVTDVVLGCTDANATNPTPGANRDDGSCTYELTVTKVVEGVTAPDFTTFSFKVDGGATTTFLSSGTNVLVVSSSTHTVAENTAVGYTTTYANCAPVVFTAGKATCTITNTKINDNTPKQCSIVSDETTLVDGVNSTSTWVHPDWTKELTSGEWIWDNTVEPKKGETVTFTKTFMVDNAPTGATLKVAADNRYVATLNGNPLTCDGTPADNFSAADTCAATVISGLNTLTFVVTNDPYGTEDVKTNPSGLIYELTIDGATCSAVPVEPNEKMYRLEGYVWHDDNKNREWERHYGQEEEEVILDEFPQEGWTVRATNGTTTMTTTTDANGYYKFDVPAGTWTITEEVKTGWERTTQESYVVVVPAPIEEARATVLDRILAYVVPTAQAAVMIPVEYTDLNFGNDTIDTIVTPDTPSRSGGGGSGTRVRPRVAGDSISTVEPTPMVLGEQVSAVPFGAPSTGRGGSARTAAVNALSQLLVSPRRLQVVK